MRFLKVRFGFHREPSIEQFFQFRNYFKKT